jgi:Mg2+/Co2+ transporter CorB
MVGLFGLLLILFAFPFTTIAFQGQAFIIVAAVVSTLVLPLFAAVVSVAFPIIVNNEIVLVQTTSDDLFVILFSDFVIDIALVLNLLGVKSLFACSPQCSQLSKRRTSRHDVLMHTYVETQAGQCKAIVIG